MKNPISCFRPGHSTATTCGLGNSRPQMRYAAISLLAVIASSSGVEAAEPAVAPDTVVNSLEGTFGVSYTITPKKAKALAFGGMFRKRVTHPGIPARPLVGFPLSDQRLVAGVLEDHLTAVINRVR